MATYARRETGGSAEGHLYTAEARRAIMISWLRDGIRSSLQFRRAPRAEADHNGFSNGNGSEKEEEEENNGFNGYEGISEELGKGRETGKSRRGRRK